MEGRREGGAGDGGGRGGGGGEADLKKSMARARGFLGAHGEEMRNGFMT